MRYVNRLPYRSEKGCQNNSPTPKSRYIYPVPSFSVAIETLDCCARGTSTEYTVATDMPENQVYLVQSALQASPMVEQTYKFWHISARSLRRGVQLRGSLGSSDGAGSKTMSSSPPTAWRTRRLRWTSTRWIVPGIESDSGILNELN
jgi:hypothetical protein